MRFCELKTAMVFKNQKNQKNFPTLCHVFSYRIPTSFPPDEAPAWGLIYISLMRCLILSISSRISRFSFNFSSTLVTEYMMVV